MNDKIANSLNMYSLPAVTSNNKVLEIYNDANKDNVNYDFELAREHTIVVLEKSREAMEELSSLALQSQSTKVYEAYAMIMNASLQASRALTKQHRELQIINNAKKPERRTKVTNQLFVGSTAELQKMLKSLNKEENTEE